MKVLFLCSANLYRSRFCELWFGHIAPTLCPSWTATSRALDVTRNGDYPHAIYEGSVAALSRLGVPLPDTHRRPAQVVLSDLETADHVVAMKSSEHRVLLENLFGLWCSRHLDRVEFWDVADYGFLDEAAAFATLKTNVEDLCGRLAKPDV